LKTVHALLTVFQTCKHAGFFFLDLPLFKSEFLLSDQFHAAAFPLEDPRNPVSVSSSSYPDIPP
jgi:hypothetical protein